MSRGVSAGATMDGGIRVRDLGPPVLHRASWVLPVSCPPVPDGAVLVDRHEILLVGNYRDVKSASPPGILQADHGDAALIPGLINGHAHLELSAFRGAMDLPQPGFPAWLMEVFRLRSALTRETMETGLLDGLQEMGARGTVLCGDITNGAFPGGSAHGSLPQREVFLELIGFNRGSMDSALDELMPGPAAVPPSHSLAAHACYSTSAAVIREAKAWCRDRGKAFSIHVAEHPEEIEFLRSGTGYCRALLESLGKWAPCWAAPGTTPVAYLEKLGVLDAGTLLVHAVHMTASDWEIVARTRATVCFCPRSNRNIGVGAASIPAAIGHGIPTCLGTDSLASNLDLNLFAEATQVLRDFPGVTPETVLAMLTLGGATALGRDKEYGTLEAGRHTAFLAVSLPNSPKPSELAEAVIHQGNGGAIQWVNHPASH